MASQPPGRDTAFAALALLRCRDRLGQVLDMVAAPRRDEVARAIAELEGLDDAHLKNILGEVVRREDSVLRDAAARSLGSCSGEAPRAIRKLAALAAQR